MGGAVKAPASPDPKTIRTSLAGGDATTVEIEVSTASNGATIVRCLERPIAELLYGSSVVADRT